MDLVPELVPQPAHTEHFLPPAGFPLEPDMFGDGLERTETVRQPRLQRRLRQEDLRAGPLDAPSTVERAGTGAGSGQIRSPPEDES